MKLEAAFSSRSESLEARSPSLLSFLQNWQLIALVAIITSVETACLAYLFVLWLPIRASLASLGRATVNGKSPGKS